MPNPYCVVFRTLDYTRNDGIVVIIGHTPDYGIVDLQVIIYASYGFCSLMLKEVVQIPIGVSQYYARSAA